MTLSPSLRSILAPAVALVLRTPASPAPAPKRPAQPQVTVEPAAPAPVTGSVRTFYITADGRVTKDKPASFVRTLRAATAADAKKLAA